MTDYEKLPEQLQLLVNDLDTAGPAPRQTATDAEQLVEDALKRTENAAFGVAQVFWLKRPAAVVVGLVIFGTSAAAAAWLYGSPAAPVVAPKPPQGSKARPRALGKHSAMSALMQDAAAVAALTATAAATADAPAVPRLTKVAHGNSKTAHPLSSSSPSSDDELDDGPPDLLAQASRLRRAGKLSDAESVYLKVVRTQPSSSAAYVARVAVAKLRLGGRPRSALRLLKEAQLAFPGGALDQEVRQAKARAYRALGQPKAEAHELRVLIRKYPQAPGVKAAKERLTELRGATR